MSTMTQAISSRFSVILAIGALLTWVVCVPAAVRGCAHTALVRLAALCRAGTEAGVFRGDHESRK